MSLNLYNNFSFSDTYNFIMSLDSPYAPIFGDFMNKYFNIDYSEAVKDYLLYKKTNNSKKDNFNLLLMLTEDRYKNTPLMFENGLIEIYQEGFEHLKVINQISRQEILDLSNRILSEQLYVYDYKERKRESVNDFFIDDLEVNMKKFVKNLLAITKLDIIKGEIYTDYSEKKLEIYLEFKLDGNSVLFKLDLKERHSEGDFIVDWDFYIDSEDVYPIIKAALYYIEDSFR